LQDSVAGIEVVQDIRSRTFTDIEKKIDKPPLGPLLHRYIKTVAKDMKYSDVFEKLWYDINQERILSCINSFANSRSQNWRVTKKQRGD
jgi:hypothetical protein